MKAEVLKDIFEFGHVTDADKELLYSKFAERQRVDTGCCCAACGLRDPNATYRRCELGGADTPAWIRVAEGGGDGSAGSADGPLERLFAEGPLKLVRADGAVFEVALHELHNLYQVRRFRLPSCACASVRPPRYRRPFA